MHYENCTCTKCQMAGDLEWGEAELPGLGEVYGGMELESPFNEAEEIELAAELLSVSNEEELDQFIGKLVKGAWKGIKKVGSVVGKIAKPLGGVLKGVAKAALPFVGGALGSFIPIPGVGTALGSVGRSPEQGIGNGARGAQSGGTGIRDGAALCAHGRNGGATGGTGRS